MHLPVEDDLASSRSQVCETLFRLLLLLLLSLLLIHNNTNTIDHTCITIIIIIITDDTKRFCELLSNRFSDSEIAFPIRFFPLFRFFRFRIRFSEIVLSNRFSGLRDAFASSSPTAFPILAEEVASRSRSDCDSLVLTKHYSMISYHIILYYIIYVYMLPTFGRRSSDSSSEVRNLNSEWDAD